MYDLYKTDNANAVGFSSYKKVFLEQFILKPKPPKKDTCHKCDTFKTRIDSLLECDEKNLIILERDKYQRQAVESRENMNLDLKTAEEDEKTETLTFDKEKTLRLPRLTTNIIFYKRQLWLYNCDIYAGKRKNSTFHVWNKGEAGRGAQEVGFCLRKHIENNITNEVENIILEWFFGGQNMNIKITLLLNSALDKSPHLKTIRLRFLVSGHTFLPNDNNFRDLECINKKQNKIFSPEDYIQIMKDCRKKGPIVVYRMKKEDFISTKKLEKEIVNRKKTCSGKAINWLHIRVMNIIIALF